MDNPKGDLIAVLAAQGHTPDFRVTTEGPAHARSFSAEIWAGEQLLGRGEGSSKREAERSAAEQALAELREDGATVAPARTAKAKSRPAASQRPHRPVVLHPTVLAEALAVADSRTAKTTPLPEVARQAASLYRELLAELGHDTAEGVDIEEA